jgi:type IV pilus assembly protein PilB
MVFSTLHTNDAPSTVTRLRDMGVPPFLITATLEAVLAQRLVRKICAECREQTMPATETLADLDLTPDDVIGKRFYHGRGCAACNNTGFKGRTGLFEYMPINDLLRDLINRGSSTEILRNASIQNGMRSLRLTGLEKVYSGVTSIEEVIRETVHEN